ncbi:MucR family transcriptional regulator [Blastococcus sp. MG754426]|uniref:MucR family transcriptional regulator n=1 Tax=unclassified Blastococcus TaxID=2619396 RepID=UPI001EEF9D6A|nr:MULTISPECIES: MucR family transcriptional regulator [unclassified Blastococcus]MCF6506209.1 MucR family transcriptional regulator [Blastococcus sp. MG754426]MCF6510413.1 MucR family transcriptional regulator [Blastococcus sp. MG754427]MCF6736988.1 MucR family transcriptional regulator [Blastococcus sp. KM273129]
MLHPVGPLPAAVYWRRRLTVLVLLLAVLAGLAWLVTSLLAGGGSGSAAAPGTAAEPTEPPALEQVVPAVSGVRTPGTTAPPSEPPVPAGPTPGSPCTDEMLGLEVRTPGTAAVGAKPVFELVVVNTSPVPCVRSLDKQLQELVMVDAAGARVWGSNDCFPESSDDERTLAPGEPVVFPLTWGGLTSEPTCTAPRVTPAPGDYVLRGRLDTKVSGDAPLTIG